MASFYYADETSVPVANCSAKEYNSNPKQIMPLKDFIHYWREYIQNGHSSPKGCLYLKDWHMQRYSSSQACSMGYCTIALNVMHNTSLEKL